MENKEISEPTYLELRDIILKFKHKNTRNKWNKVRDFIESGSSFMEEDTSFN
jgi:hypothetical protein